MLSSSKSSKQERRRWRLTRLTPKSLPCWRQYTTLTGTPQHQNAQDGSSQEQTVKTTTSTSTNARAQTPATQSHPLQSRQSQQRSVSGKQRKDPRHKWTDDEKPICASCTKPGHLYRHCKKQRRVLVTGVSSSPSETVDKRQVYSIT